jgi:Na+/H+ antiporter NhaD/arsenite permease-like protein
MRWYALAVFVFTYVLLSQRRAPFFSLDRPTGALLGAALMVAGGVLSVEEALRAVDWHTIALLFGMLVLAAYASEAGAFSWLAERLGAWRRRPRGLLVLLCLGSGLLSALLLNDTVCLMLTPIVVALSREAGLAPKPFLFGVALSANVGGVMTFTGNPQNMIVGARSGIGYARYFLETLPVGLLGLLLTALWLCWYFRAELQAAPEAPRLGEKRAASHPIDRALLGKSSVALCAVVLAFLLGFDLAGSAVFGAAVLIAFGKREPRPLLERIDWPLLLFFAGLFVVVRGVSASGLTQDAAGYVGGLLKTPPGVGVPLFSLASLVGSNLFSNVPFVLVVSDVLVASPEAGLFWRALALSATFAGNLTLLGSVANLIVFEGAREVTEVSFWEYLRVGLPLTLATTALGVLSLLSLAWLGWL